MRKLVLAVCAVMLLVLIISGGNNQAGDKTAPEIMSVTEAAFSMRNSKCEDATSFLVGRFTNQNGKLLCFDGLGEVKEVATNLVTQIGRCSLTQSDDGAAVLRIEKDQNVRLYAFRIYAPEGGFVLTDSDGKTEIYTPMV